MFEGSGSGGSGGGAGSSQLAAMLQGYATQSWVDENYVGIEFFNRLFRMHGDNDTVIVPNDLDTTIQNIEARFGLWTESFLSALGLNSGGGGGGSVSYLNDLLDVSISNPTVGEGLIYDGTRWVNGPVGGGGSGSVESVGLSMPTGFSVTGSPVTSSGTLAVTFASGYSLPTTAKQSQWDTAYSWGDHSQEGYATQSWVNAKGYTTNAGTVTSVRMTVPAGLTVTGSPITTSGTLAISLGTGYSIPTTAKQSQWDTAYGWGNHADAGYATQTALAAATADITTLKGYFTGGSANTALRLAGNDTRYAWGQPFWQNGVPVNTTGNMDVKGYINHVSILYLGYGSANPSIYASLNGSDRMVMDVNDYGNLSFGYGTGRYGATTAIYGTQIELNIWDDDRSTYKRAMYADLDTDNYEANVNVVNTLYIGGFPVKYDAVNNALCFTGNIYATGGVSALGFSSTQNGGALINGQLDVAAAMNVSGDATMNGDLSVAGEATLGSLKITNGTNTYTLDVAAAMNVSGDATMNGDLSVAGEATLGSLKITNGTNTYTLDVAAAIRAGILK